MRFSPKFRGWEKWVPRPPIPPHCQEVEIRRTRSPVCTPLLDRATRGRKFYCRPHATCRECDRGPILVLSTHSSVVCRIMNEDILTICVSRWQAMSLKPHWGTKRHWRTSPPTSTLGGLPSARNCENLLCEAVKAGQNPRPSRRKHSCI
jgi:hypothetical protein